MSDLPVRWTFVDFHPALPSKRSSSAPPGFMSTAVAGNLHPRKRRSRVKKLHQPKNDDIALQEFHTRATMERWAHLARNLCSKFARDAKAESNLALRMRGSLPRYLFGDWAYYTFVAKGHADILSQLHKSGFIHENKESNRFEFWSNDACYLDPKNALLRNLVLEADKLLDARDRGCISFLVNGNIVVCVLWDPKLLLGSVISRVRSVLKMDQQTTVAKHRNRTLHPGKLCYQKSDLGPGPFFSIDFI